MSNAVVYIDFHKAFDCVSVPKLLHKLKLSGIEGNLLSCIESLLFGRSFQVRVGNALSSVGCSKSGVPQGSVLGPVLFILFINDLISFLPSNYACKLFADDVKSFKSFRNIPEILDLTNLLDKIFLWSKNWQLPLSPSKCNWIIIGKKYESPNILPELSIDGNIINRLDEVTDLGILFSSDLKFSDHINSIVSKSKQRVFLIFKIFTCQNHSAIVKAFQSYVSYSCT